MQEAWKNLVINFNTSQIWLCILFCLLWLANLILEVLKWQFATKKIEDSNFLQATKAVLVGQSFAFNSFNNIGEALGKALCLKPQNRIAGGYASMVGTLSIILATYVFGWFGGVYLKIAFPENTIITLGMPVLPYVLVMFVCLILLILAFKWYYNLKVMPLWIKKIVFGKQDFDQLTQVTSYSKMDLTFLLLFSLCRFVLYSIQFVVTLKLFAINTNILHTTLLSFLFFSLLLSIPSIAFAELAIRGQVSVYLFGLLTTNTLGIVCSAAIFWLLNKVVPAIFGTVLALNLKIYKTK